MAVSKAKAKAARQAKTEQIMEFVEQPISYPEARAAVARFEHTFKMPSDAVFSGRCDTDQLNAIGSDALFEWRSQYEFVCEVNRRVAAELAAHPTVEAVVYSN